MAIILVICVAALGGWFIAEDRRQRMRERIAGVTRLHGPAGLAGPDVALRWYHHVGRMLSNSPLVGRAERDKLAASLARAGIRAERAVLVFIAAKFSGLLGAISAAALVGGSLGFLDDLSITEVSILLGVGVIGWRLPDLVLASLTRRRRREIEAGLADAIDLLVICAEAGLSLEIGLDRVRRDLATAHPALSDELRITIAEMRLIADRRAALDNFASRTGLRVVQSIVTTLGQTLRYGTPLAASLRIIASELRQARLLRIDERVGRLPVLLTLPMIVFILPCLFMVIAGPAAFDLIDTIIAG
jgi:tight adherence protein C